MDPWQSPTVIGSIVVESDVTVAEDHPLLLDLAKQRERMETLLELRRSNRPIHVRLLRDRSTYERYVRRHFPGFPDRRAFFVEAEGRIAVYAYWGERMAEDLRHELAHGHLHAAISHVPLWLDEGVAEFFETPERENGFHAAHARRLNARQQLGWRPDLERMEGIESADQFTQDDYAEAWAWVYYLIMGPADHRRRLVQYLRQPRVNESRGSLADVLGDLKEHERQLVKWIALW
jgi:hypothetical protein